MKLESLETISQKRLMSTNMWIKDVLEISSVDNVRIRIEALTPQIIRVRYAAHGYFQKDFSYAIDPNFRKINGIAIYNEQPEFVEIATSEVKCRVNKSDLKVSFLDSQDRVINEEEKGFHWEEDDHTGNDHVKMCKKVRPSEVFFGLGDKPSELNLKGKQFQNWGTDCYGYDYGSDPLYKNIPFYYGLHDQTGYGIFFDNSFRTFFDFGKECEEVCSFWALGGEMNYYFIAGPGLLDVTMRYASLTGTPDMPAMWSLGFQQCKWSYYPESEVREVTSLMREHKIPCDAIYLDIDYMDGYRCFTWDYERFPHPKKMIADLKEQGFKTMVIIDPGIKIDPEYKVFKEAFEKDYFCKRPDGPYVKGKVWPGDCYFPDFTRPEVRAWWSNLYEELIADFGVAGVWNDMNEPALFEVSSKTMPDDVLFNYDDHPCSHRKAHNIYGMQMARATYEGVKRHSKNKRGLIITRSGYSGLQRYSSVWTGDNKANWEHIWLANIQCQRLSISGISFAGSDIGGFIGRPSPEMFVRWIQLAIFHPFCRAHSSQDDGDQEPWSFGVEALDLFREAIELRYRMLPYHYTAFYEHHKTGKPILKPLSFFDQNDPKTYHRDHEFICGDHILTSSVTRELAKTKEVYLPEGNWYNYWTDRFRKGGEVVTVHLTDDTFPLYVREGAIIPFYPVQQYVDEQNIKEVELHIYYKNGEEESKLYEDAHDGYQYESGAFRYSKFILNGLDNKLVISQSVSGYFRPTYKNYMLTLHGFPKSTILLYADKERVLEHIVPIDFKEIRIEW